MPVIKHYDGICIMYVDKDADLAMAEAIVVNAKCQRPGVCNAVETVLVHHDIAEKFFATCAITSTPTMSPSRKVPVFGQPIAAPVSVSTSSIERPCCCMRRANRSLSCGDTRPNTWSCGSRRKGERW